MVFSSPIFLFYFLPVVLLLFFIAGKHTRVQNVILFFSSLLFYFWGEKSFTVVVLVSILINYLTALALEFNERYRKIVLALGIMANLLLLLYFKYVNFFILQVLPFFHAEVNDYHQIHLPLGISFYTFHGITYIVDIYRREAKRCDSLLNTGLYILFFPQLIAGPIIKFRDIEHQLYQRIIRNEDIYQGVRRFVIGLAKKLLLANALGRIADEIFGLHIADMSTPVIWLGAIAYAYQVYYDFSGYSDMAIGLARIVGFEFKENFNFPFSATSFSDLWQRWHMSLTGFFKSYVYIPLGGNRKGTLRTYLHILIVFTFIGFWHGASWNCILWGLFVGVFLGLEKLFIRSLLDKMPHLIGNVWAMFLFITAILIFRMEDFNRMFDVMAKAFGWHAEFTGIYPISYFFTRENIVLFMMALLLAYPWQKLSWISAFVKQRRSVRWLVDIAYLLLFIVTLSVMSASTYNPFIYFKF